MSFDVYGTILNWEPEIATFLRDWVRDSGTDVPLSELLETYDRLRQPLQDERPALRYPEVLMQTLDALADAYEIKLAPERRETFGGIAATHRPFDDSVQALDDLRAMGFKLAALSNVDEHSFGLVTSRAGISFDVVVTAERVGAYKPNHAHFWAALSDLRAMGIPMARVLHVAQSRRADIVVANAIGLTSVWVNRPGHIFGRVGRGAEAAKPDYEIDSLAGVVTQLGSA
ncbi:MAG: HAD hydrolase-like protein [Alphaproteobacteria bacterium]|nr:HAD hydrolase-like protein [Alphaproteobacteria bacterium]